MNSIKLTMQRNICQLRRFHKCITVRQATAVAEPAIAAPERMTIPIPEGVEKPVNPKIDKLVNDITALNLIEVAELSDLLKKRLNLPDAPVMPMGGFAVAPKEEDEDDTKTKAVKSSFNVKLKSYDEKQKVALIKEIKNLMPDTNLVQAKKFVESAPNIVKADVDKEEAEKLKEALTKVGGVIEVE